MSHVKNEHSSGTWSFLRAFSTNAHTLWNRKLVGQVVSVSKSVKQHQCECLVGGPSLRPSTLLLDSATAQRQSNRETTNKSISILADNSGSFPVNCYPNLLLYSAYPIFLSDRTPHRKWSLCKATSKFSSQNFRSVTEYNGSNIFVFVGKQQNRLLSSQITNQLLVSS